MNIAATIITIAIMIFGFAGGGGSSSGGSSGGSSSSSSSSYSSYSSSSSSGSGGTEMSSDAASAMVAIFFSVGICIFIWLVFNNKNQKQHFVDHNSTDQEKRIHLAAEHIFTSYQEDWSEFRVEDIKTFTTDRYYAHASLMLELLKNMHRTNKVSQLKVHRVYLLEHVPDDIKSPINIHIAFEFSGLDEVITDSGEKLYSQFVPSATETWTFVYDGENLKLDGISQPTESSPHLVKSLADFASKNRLFYSPDWGRYCLPARGLIFGGASMKIADINNHVIGKWAVKNAENSAKIPEGGAYDSSANRGENAGGGDGLLVQLYTYASAPGQSTSSYYVVGQINVPKDYLGVIVRSKKLKFSGRPDKSYDKFELEWPDFNRRYDVFAASRDALPAFELLNPKFMEFLYSKNPNYSLEVVDNVIYIYAKVWNVTEKDYVDMLEVLRRAHKELKM